MITATATGAHGERILVLGVTKENLERLTQGQFIRVSAETHPGFPQGLKVLVVFGETERDLVQTLQPLMSDEETKIVVVPLEKGTAQ
jgi:hypothetical protein